MVSTTDEPAPLPPKSYLDHFPTLPLDQLAFLKQQALEDVETLRQLYQCIRDAKLELSSIGPPLPLSTSTEWSVGNSVGIAGDTQDGEEKIFDLAAQTLTDRLNLLVNPLQSCPIIRNGYRVQFVLRGVHFPTREEMVKKLEEVAQSWKGLTEVKEALGESKSLPMDQSVLLKNGR